MARVRLSRKIRAVLTFLSLGILVALSADQLVRWYYPVPFRETVVRYALTHDLDPLLVTAVMRVESNFDPLAVSIKGARGLMQIMPETAEWIADQVGMPEFDVEMLFEPEINVALGAWYLADLHRLFEGETVLALAAYNGGRANVMRWLRDSAWSGKAEEISDIPFPETRSYVRKVLAMYAVYQRVWGKDAEGWERGESPR